MVNSVTEGISRFVDSVGETITITFKAIDDFIDSIITFFVGLGFWTSVITFFILFFGLLSIPLFLFRYWENITNEYDKLTKKLIKSISSD